MPSSNGFRFPKAIRHAANACQHVRNERSMLVWKSLAPMTNGVTIVVLAMRACRRHSYKPSGNLEQITIFCKLMLSRNVCTYIQHAIRPWYDAALRHSSPKHQQRQQHHITNCAHTENTAINKILLEANGFRTAL